MASGRILFYLAVFVFDYRFRVLEQKRARRHESIDMSDKSPTPNWHALHGDALLACILAYTGTGHRVRRCRALEPTAPPPPPGPRIMRQLISCVDALPLM